MDNNKYSEWLDKYNSQLEKNNYSNALDMLQDGYKNNYYRLTSTYPVCNEELYGITNELVGAWVRHLELFENSSNLMNTTTPLNDKSYYKKLIDKFENIFNHCGSRKPVPIKLLCKQLRYNLKLI